MVAAIVLSAGESSRMGSPKALLSIGRRTFIEEIVSSLTATKVGKIIVVLGHHAEEIRSKIRHLAVAIVVNPDYAQGQLSSLNAAIRALETEKVDAILVHLVDQPFLNPDLVNRMVERFYESEKLIVVPTYKGRRGHPVLFSSRLFSELLSAPLDQGAKAVVRAHPDETLEIETDDEGVTLDIDTPEDYQRHIGRRDVQA
jgi:molybdenum cofactor cytidylyltransferase